MFAVRHLRVEFGPRVLFQDLSFSIGAKDRLALAGPNGAGKSTLMKCLAGELEPNAGEITYPRGLRIGYLAQEGIHIEGTPLLEEVLTVFSEARRAEERIQALTDEMAQLDSQHPRYHEILEQIGELELQLDGHETSKLRPRAEATLQGLGFDRADLQRDCGEFSGGWQMRIAMAKLFLREPELLLMDEPTNHLDVDTQRWVENYLRSYPGALVLISHDRAMLDGLTTRTIAFHHGRAEEFTGNFSDYERQLEERQAVRRKQYKAQQREIEKTRAFIDKFRAKATKASQAQSRLKQLEKMDVIELEDDSVDVMGFRFPSPPPSAHRVLKLEGLCHSYGSLKVFENLDLEITRGEKIAIVGPNGAGKSTFCRLVTAQEAPVSGTLEHGSKVLPSFFSQNHADELNGEQTILEAVESVATREAQSQVRTLLGSFLFRGDDVFKPIGVLSGGERSRVALVRMLVQPANFLILDEPTNHLDLQSQDVLQQALLHYEGSVLIVSHNRSFLDPLVTKTLEFRKGQPPHLYHGNLSYYLEKTAEQPPSPTPGQPAKGQHATSPATPGISRKEQRKREAEQRRLSKEVLGPIQQKLETTESQITELEEEQADLTKTMSDPKVAADGEQMLDLSERYRQVSARLEQAYTQWSELSDTLERKQSEMGLSE